MYHWIRYFQKTENRFLLYIHRNITNNNERIFRLFSSFVQRIKILPAPVKQIYKKNIKLLEMIKCAVPYQKITQIYIFVSKIES